MFLPKMVINTATKSPLPLSEVQEDVGRYFARCLDMCDEAPKKPKRGYACDYSRRDRRYSTEYSRNTGKVSKH